MNRISPTVAAVVAGILALLLVIYVFAGGNGRARNQDKLSDAQVADAPPPPSETQCSSQKTYDLIKSELFRQAADMRGDDAGTFSNVASYAFLRVAEPKLITDKQDSGIIGCAGAVTLDLPPGLTVAGGRRSLSGDVGYQIRPASGAGEEIVTVTNADAIIIPLATLSRASAAADPAADQRQERAPQERAPQAPTVEPRAATPRRAEPAPAKPPARPAAVRPAPAPPREPGARPLPVEAAPRATASPSFNCRNARTKGEIAVCGDIGLASLDRQMADQFNRALSTADAGKRSQLQRSRTRFLRFRNSCGTQACMAGAYRERMREIDDIMNERWSPR